MQKSMTFLFLFFPNILFIIIPIPFGFENVKKAHEEYSCMRLRSTAVPCLIRSVVAPQRCHLPFQTIQS